MGENNYDAEAARTLYVGNIAEGTSEDLLYELFLQAGPLQYVKIPTDRISKRNKNFAFVSYHHECSVNYAIHLFNNIKLCGNNLRVQSRNMKTPLKSIHEVGIQTLDPDYSFENKSTESNNMYNSPNNQFFPQNQNYDIQADPSQRYYSNSPNNQFNYSFNPHTMNSTTANDRNFEYNRTNSPNNESYSRNYYDGRNFHTSGSSRQHHLPIYPNDDRRIDNRDLRIFLSRNRRDDRYKPYNNYQNHSDRSRY